MKRYFDALKKGDSLENIPAVEERPQRGLSVVGTPTSGVPKTTFGGTSGSGLSTTLQPSQTFAYKGRTWTTDSFLSLLDMLDGETVRQHFPPTTWAQFPDIVRQRIRTKAAEDQHLAYAESLISIERFLIMLRETDAIFDRSKPTTFNWWGAVGDPLGKIIDGEVPVKKKKKHDRK
jgi:hypothetical protein